MEDLRVKDFKNTWCKATEENYNKLVKLNFGKLDYIPNNGFLYFFNKTILNSTYKNFLSTDFGRTLKQIKLVDNEFYYVEEEHKEPKECSICGEPKEICPSEETCSYRIEYEDTKREEMEECQFKKFGFEVPDNIEDFEYKLDYIDKINNIVGTIDGCGSIWSSKGECIFTSHPSYKHFFNLTSIEKEWFEDDFSLKGLQKFIKNTLEKDNLDTDFNVGWNNALHGIDEEIERAYFKKEK